MLEVILAAVALVVIPALFLGLVRFLRENVPPGAISEVRAWLFQAGPRGLGTGWYVAAVALGLFVLLVGANIGPRDEEGLLALLALMALVVLGVFLYAWRREFLFLMSLRDDAFPGRFDKPIWAATLVLLAPIGFWLFRSYRLAHWAEAKPETIRGDMAAELS